MERLEKDPFLHIHLISSSHIHSQSCARNWKKQASVT